MSDRMDYLNGDRINYLRGDTMNQNKLMVELTYKEKRKIALDFLDGLSVLALAAKYNLYANDIEQLIRKHTTVRDWAESYHGDYGKETEWIEW